MYRNLKAEMIRKNVSAEDIAKALNIKEPTARLKINGKIGFRYSQCQKIADLFNKEFSIDYLFDSDTK